MDRMSRSLAPGVAACLLTLAWLVSGCDGDEGTGGAPAGGPAPAAAGAGAAGPGTTTPSGLRYEVLAPGTGTRKPRTGDRVRVHYTGWLTDGREFDSSRKRGEPTEFALGPGLIAGWNEALALMVKGARWKITVPPSLAYGPQGRPPTIPASATLVFDIELLAVMPAPALPEFHAPAPADQKVTPSGLKYEVLDAGAGDAPTADATVDLEFAFWNRDGTLLDCSAMQRGQTITAPVGEMRLPFLKEAPLLMKPGARFRFEVPAALAFGDRAMGPQLPAGATTIWEIRLVRCGTPQSLPEFVLPAGEGLRRTPTGLGYQVLEEGSGDPPGPASRVVVDYAGWLADGTCFDASYSRGLDATFSCDGVIPGWSEGLRLMRPGAVYRFLIPPDLGYGARGAGEKIPPGATLVFHVRLRKVLPAAGEEPEGDGAAGSSR